MIKNKEILIIGGTGSLARALLPKLIKHQPRGVRLLSRNESKQWELKQKLKKYKYDKIQFCIGNIRDINRMLVVTKNVDIVIHTAALKHITTCEQEPEESLKTNILGTLNVRNACMTNNVKKAVFINTDKACYSTTVYGSCKFISEKLWIEGNKKTGNRCTFFACRYGNVLGSSGSIIPLFCDQAKTGILTITDIDMTRFWITLTDVTDFIIDRIADAENGCVYIPKMPSGKIIEIAKIIGPECKMKEIGIRETEKLHETLITTEESYHCMVKDSYYIINPNYFISIPFSYNSKNNPDFLKGEKLKAKIMEVLNVLDD